MAQLCYVGNHVNCCLVVDLYEYISIFFWIDEKNLVDKPVLKPSDLVDFVGCVKVENYWIKFCQGRMKCFVFLDCICDLHFRIL